MFQVQGRHILLLLDNAPSHVTTDLQLESIKVEFLPPNCTSKVQPMDAGIIAAFKRHYCWYHYQHALDRDEEGEQNIYKVDQLTAMHWCHAAWNEISSQTIANCNHHTGLFVEGPILDPERMGVEVDVEEQAMETELESILLRLPLRNPMVIKDLLNLPEENGFAHIELTDKEIIDIVQASETEQDAEEDNITPAEARLTKAEKLHGLGVTLSLLDVSNEQGRMAYKYLRSLQNSIRYSSIAQSTLDTWLQ